MTPNSVEIEQLVREVLARLDLRTAIPQPASGQPAAVEPTTVTNGAAVGVLTLHERVVTAEWLSRRLNGVRQLIVPRGAVVTPSAKDLLREQNIGWDFGTASTAAASSQRTLIVGVSETTFSPAALIRGTAKQGVRVEQVANAGLAAVTKEIGDQVALSGALGLLLTAATAAALCVANRRSGVRASYAQSVEQVDDGIQSVGANLLVTNPTTTSYFQLQRMVTRFCDPAPRTCPEHLARVL